MGYKIITYLRKFILCAFVIGSIWGLVSYNNHLNDKCSALEPDKVKLAVARYYTEHLNRGGVSVVGADGRYVSYPIVPFESAREFLEKYPDCCRYYPDGRPTGYTLHPIQISFWERFLEWKCAFVGLVRHYEYIVDGVITKNRSPNFYSLIIDSQYEISPDPKDR